MGTGLESELDRLKLEMCRRVMGAPAEAVYDVDRPEDR